MSEKKTETLPEGQISLEDTFAEIEAIIAKMEQPDVTLDESFSLYKNGVERLKTCNELLDSVEKKMQVIEPDGTLGDF